MLPSADASGFIGTLLRPWFRFDSAWYVGVAQSGYHYGALGKANTNFMPVYPLLIRGFGEVSRLNLLVCALIVANVAALAASVMLWQWAVARWGETVALRVVLFTVFFPFAFFLATPYAEPVFLLLAVAAFTMADRDRWGWATALGGIAAVTRPVGAAVVLGLAVQALAQRKPRDAAIALLGFLPLIAFALYLWLEVGHPLAFLTYHSAGWVAPRGSVLTSIVAQFHTSLSPFDKIDAAAAVLFLISGLLAWRRIGPGYGVYVLTGVLLPLAHGLVSMERYVAVLFPAFAVWGASRRAVLRTALLGAGFSLFLLFGMMFAAGYSIF